MAWTPYTEIVYDDATCKVVIEECEHMRGCYYVTVDDDPEHYLSTSSIGRIEAEDDAEEIRQQFIEDNGQFGVGA